MTAGGHLSPPLGGKLGEAIPLMKRRDFLCKTTALGAAWAVLPSFGVRSLAAGSAGRFRDTQVTNLSGETTAIPAKAIKDFAARLRGRLVTMNHEDYDQARRLWNKMFDER